MYRELLCYMIQILMYTYHMKADLLWQRELNSLCTVSLYLSCYLHTIRTYCSMNISFNGTVDRALTKSNYLFIYLLNIFWNHAKYAAEDLVLFLQSK